MKKKLLLLTVLVIALSCLFAIVASATDIPEWTGVITYETGENAIAYKDGFDTTSRVMLSNDDGTYSTYPTNYIIKGTDSVFTARTELDFTALNTASGKTYSYASVIRLEIPVGFTELATSALRGPADKGNFSSLLTAKIPEGVTKLNSYTLYGDSLVQEIELPSTLTTLGQEFANGNPNLRKVNIPSGITTIPQNAFKNCTSLTEVDFSKATNLESIGSYAFRSAALSETEVIFYDKCTSVGEYAFKGTGIKSLVIPSTVTTIGKEAFAENTNLSKVICKCKDIPYGAFTDCTGLTSLTLENTVSIGERAFFASSGKTIPITNVILPEGLVSIGQFAFLRSSITSIVVPSTVTTYGTGVFQSCSSLEKAVILGSTMGKEMFHSDKALESLIITDKLTTIESGALTSTNTSSFTIFYTGTDYENIKALGSASGNGYTKFKDAKYSSYESYKANTHTQGTYLFIYGANLCEVAFDGVHAWGETIPTFEGQAYVSNLVSASTCGVCKLNDFVGDPICGPLFIELGYSKPNDNSSFGYGVSVNQANIDKYIEATGDTLVYGFIIGLYSDKVADIISADGKSQISNSIIFDFSKPAYDNLDRFTLKFTSISDPSLELCCNVYVIANSEKVSYLGAIDNKTLKPVAVTVETIPTKED